MLRRPSHFITPSASVSRQDQDVKRKGDDERKTISSVATFQDEILRSRKQTSSLKDRRSEPSVSESKSSKSISSKETRKLIVGEQIKMDILHFLDNLIEKAEWLVLLFYVKD